MPNPRVLHVIFSGLIGHFLLVSSRRLCHRNGQWVRGLMAFTLVGMYVAYLTLTIRASTDLVDDGHGTEADHPLYSTKIGLPDNLVMILVQLAFGLGLIMLGAKGFVYGIEHLAPRCGGFRP